MVVKSSPQASLLTTAIDADARGTPLTQLLRLAVLVLVLVAASGCTGGSESESQDEVAVTESGGIGDPNDATSVDDSGSDDDGNGGSTASLVSIAAMPSPLSTMLPGLIVTDFVVVSSVPTGRTTMEYVLRLKISNSSSQTYRDVQATLQGAPQHIVIIDDVATVGDVPPNSTILSSDSFIVDVNLALNTSFDDFVWLIEGDVKPPPPPQPPGPRPGAAGIFMKIEDPEIAGESKSDSHRDWIVLTSVMEGLHRDNLSSGSTRRRSSFVFDGTHVGKLLDRSSPKLRETLADGTIFGEVRIEIVEDCGGNLYTPLVLTLTTAALERLSLHAEQSDRPTENLSFNYSRIEAMYTPVEDDCTLLPPLFSTQDGELLKL